MREQVVTPKPVGPKLARRSPKLVTKSFGAPMTPLNGVASFLSDLDGGAKPLEHIREGGDGFRLLDEIVI
jgi:hypothetical protein